MLRQYSHGPGTGLLHLVFLLLQRSHDMAVRFLRVGPLLPASGVGRVMFALLVVK
jgi:hypothetical protein